MRASSPHQEVFLIGRTCFWRRSKIRTISLNLAEVGCSLMPGVLTSRRTFKPDHRVEWQVRQPSELIDRTFRIAIFQIAVGIIFYPDADFLPS